MKFYLVKMLEMYEPDKIDWMNFDITSSNPYSFHHIEKKEDGGRARVDNGAVLSKYSHRFLHYLEQVCPDAFEDYQDLFRRVNASCEPRTQDFIDEADVIMFNILNGGYNFIKNVSIDDMNETFLMYYNDGVKVKKLVK